MLLIRPITLNDLDQLERLAIESGPGMTNLPNDRGLLEKKILRSIASFARPVSEPGEETYLWVMEDTATAQVVGTSSIIASVGLSRPFYSYRVLHLAHTSQELYRYQPVSVLQMVNEYRGVTEIATLYLTPAYRRNSNGKLLSRCRFLMLAEFPQRFSSLVIAEMRGVHDQQGHSVFWDSLGQHFFDMEFSKADFLSSLGQYQFIADLMPKYPIYICLLPEAAQAVIGVTHPATRPALELLKREGFSFEGCVDVFDAGPTLHCRLDQIRTVRESNRATVAQIVATVNSESFIISTTGSEDFRACRGHLRLIADQTVQITQDVAAALALQPGDTVRFTSF